MWVYTHVDGWCAREYSGVGALCVQECPGASEIAQAYVTAHEQGTPQLLVQKVSMNYGMGTYAPGSTPPVPVPACSARAPPHRVLARPPQMDDRGCDIKAFTRVGRVRCRQGGSCAEGPVLSQL
eukprot:COSAG01_NODE_4408_length_5059_cov_2.693565_5_plen_124_part_00